MLYDAYRRYYGASGPDNILVAYGTSRDTNPSLSEAEIQRELEKDPVRNRAEYLSEWRDDVKGFIPRDIVDASRGPISACEHVNSCDKANDSTNKPLFL